ncbi:MAG TPA: hypothetical protein VFK06_25235 [Candidatus Angelobacter sp.]|nr:hypothetical protein [Candidatus Angelobacter sp.]
MTASELKEHLQRSKAEAEALSQLWMCLIGPAPDARYFHSLLYRNGYDATKSAVERTAVKFSQLNGTMTEDYALKYCATCAKNATGIEQQGRQTLSDNTLMKHAALRTRSR